MKTFFVLGNNQPLSVAEIAAVFPSATDFELPEHEILTAEIDDFEEGTVIKRLGGTIKIGKTLSFLPSRNPEKIKEEVLKLLKEVLAERKETNKFCFGFSYYGDNYINTQNIGLTIKKEFKQEDLSCRFVVSKEKTLSSVVVEQNNLTSGGAEIILIERPEGIIFGRTLAVQDFKGLEKRDYKRPDRDDQSGMLPPKLAQAMINLSGKISSETNNKISILDPFCGSGTVLQEAALMGVKKLIGSDISEKAISDTESNMKWLAENWQLPADDWKTFKISAENISQKIPRKSIDVIVTEPYLGPQRGWHDIGETKKELETLYASALKEFEKILKDDGRVVMVWPVFAPRPGHAADYLEIDISSWEKISVIPAQLKDSVMINRRGTVIYSRPNQKIWREMVVLKKK
jgi:tRNA (guanine10-N2)-dimethyltransferase